MAFATRRLGAASSGVASSWAPAVASVASGAPVASVASGAPVASVAPVAGAARLVAPVAPVGGVAGAVVGASRGAPARAFSANVEQYLGLQLSNDEMTSATELDRKTKIVATVGPSSIERIPELLQAGANVLRVNCSHGDHDFYREVKAKLDEACSNAAARGTGAVGEAICALAFDTKGPEIRTGAFRDSLFEDGSAREVSISTGSEVTLVTDPAAAADGTRDEVFVDHLTLPSLLKRGDCIFVDDGLLQLRVEDLSDDRIVCVAQNSTKLGERKGVNLPGIQVDLPAISEKDRKDLYLAHELGVDFVFASFIRQASHVQQIRGVLGESVKVISKIENQEGIDNFEEILRASHGIMVARGDLGIEIPFERVFLAQKHIVASCNRAGKPVICATQMLESMISNPRPTRAEVVDVANAVLDGTDAVMLSGETAKGKYPIEAISVMGCACRAAEVAMDHRGAFAAIQRVTSGQTRSTSEVLASAAVHAAFEERATCIMVVTASGSTARQVAKFRPSVPIIALTPVDRVGSVNQLIRGVHTIMVDPTQTVDEVLERGKQVALDLGISRYGDHIVALHGRNHVPTEGDTNIMRVITLN